MSNKIYIKVNGVWRDAYSVYRKRNGGWHKASDDVYKMINGAWVNQNDKSAIFDPDALFLYNDFRVDENVSAHIDVTCFDGGDGSVTVVASGGTPPYQYSLDPTFATYNSTGVFTGLSLVAPVDEGTDQYGGILISHRTFYVRDANGQIIGGVIDLKSPVQLDIVLPDNITVFAENCIIYIDSQNRKYAIIEEPFEPYPTTRANGFGEIRTDWPSNNRFQLSTSNPVTVVNMLYDGWNNCGEYYSKYYTIEILPAYYPNAIQDYDGNWYDAVVIGDQVWLAQNLRTTHYSNGTAIPAGGSSTSGTDPYYYDNSSSNISLRERGYLYNWPAVMNGEATSDLNPSGVQGIAPTGWHVPSDAECTQLKDYVNSQSAYRYNDENLKIGKALAYNDYWDANGTAGNVGNDQSTNNATLFGGITTGYCLGSSFYYTTQESGFWTTSKFNNSRYTTYSLLYNSNTLNRMALLPTNGYSVRCVCDLSPLDFAAWYYNQYGSYNHQIVV